MENFHQKCCMKLRPSNLHRLAGSSCLGQDLAVLLLRGNPQQSSASTRQPHLLCMVTGENSSSAPWRFCSPGVWPCKCAPPKYPWKARYSQYRGLFYKLPGGYLHQGSLQHSSQTRARERNPEAITNLEHLFMQLIFLKGKKAKNNNKKTVNNSWGCVVQSTSDVSLFRHPSLGPTAPSSSTGELPCGTSPFGSSSWMLPAFRITFSAYRQNRSNLVFFLGFNFFPFFFWLLFCFY